MKQLLMLLFLAFQSHSFGHGWIQRADFGGEARHRTTALAIGNHVYFGLGHYNGAGPNIILEDWWEYDPATNAWTQKADYMGGPTYHASGFTIDNIGYVGTGRIPGSVLVNDFYSYDPTTNSWTQLNDVPGPGRRGGVGFAINGQGYIGTGSGNNDMHRYDPTTGNWTTVSSMPTGGRISAVGFELNGYGYVGTGDLWGATNDFWKYDPTFDTWTQMAPVGPIPRQEASGFAVNGKGYILTGDDFSSGNNYKDMWEYDPTLNAWTQIEDFPGTARRYLSCITLGDMVYAGLGTNGTNFKDFWLFDPVLRTIEQELDQLQVISYPNPASDYVQIELKNYTGDFPKELKFSLYSLQGSIVRSIPFNQQKLSIETGDLKGQFIGKIQYMDKTLKSMKLIIN